MPSLPAAPGPRWTEWTSVTLPSSLDQVGPVVDRLRGWLRERGAPEGEALEGVVLALTEALTNSIRHGSAGGRSDARVRLAWAWSEGVFEAEVSEPGHFEPAATWGALPDDPLAEGGRGGFLITELMDAVEHRNADGRHALRLRKRLDVAPPAIPAETEAVLNAMTEELGNAYETISALFQFAELLATEPGLRTLAEKSFARLRPITGADGAWVRLADGDGRLVPLSTDHPDFVRTLEPTSPACEAEVARLDVERTLERRSALPLDDPLHRADGCAFVCPFSFEGRLRGVLTVTRDGETAGFFTAGQIALVRTLADFLGIACASADLQEQRQQRQRAARELEIAAQIQRGLLPQNIALHPCWQVHGVCSQAAEVGGDFFDVLDLPGGGRLVVIADVMGKGVPAALMATTLRTALRAHAIAVPDPGSLLSQVNRQLCPDLRRLEMFITAQVVLLDAAGASIAHAGAAHCPLLSLDAAGHATWHEVNGLPLGVDANETYASDRFPFAAGNRLLLMTDGVLEHEDEAGRPLEADGVAALAASLWVEGAGSADQALLRALRERAGAKAPSDDSTLVAITRTPRNDLS